MGTGGGSAYAMTVSFTAGLWAASTLSGGAVPAAQVALCRLPLLPEISRSLGRAEHWLPRRSLSWDDRKRQLPPADF